MKLDLNTPGGVYPPLQIELQLAYPTESPDGLAIHLATEEASEPARVFSLTIPRYWVEEAFLRAFAFDGAPVTLEEVENEESDAGAVARADAPKESNATFDVFGIGLGRQVALSKAASELFEGLLRERLAAFLQGLLEAAVQEVRDDEDNRARVPLPWSERLIPVGKKRGARRGDPLRYYLMVRARELRTGETPTDIFSESLQPDRARTRYYDGRKVYRYLRRRRF